MEIWLTDWGQGRKRVEEDGDFLVSFNSIDDDDDDYCYFFLNWRIC